MQTQEAKPVVGKFLQAVTFAGVQRKVDEPITEDMVSEPRLTRQARDALIAHRIIKLDGFAAPGEAASGLSADDKALISSVQASFDRYREESTKLLMAMIAKIDALSKKRPAARRRDTAQNTSED